MVIFGSLMMTNLSAEQLVGRNGQGYAAGMTAMGWETMCPIALTLMALFFIPKYFKLGISTIPEFLEAALTAQPASLYRSFSLSLIL